MPSFRIEVKVPDPKKFDSQAFIDRLIEAQTKKTGPALKSLFLKTVEGWEHKPTFGIYHFQTARSVSVQVRTVSGIMANANQYALVSKGAPPHVINPRNAPFLRFQVGYRAATRPRIIGSRSKERFGSYAESLGVSHPGFEGREFDVAIGEHHKPDFERDMAEAMKQK